MTRTPRSRGLTRDDLRVWSHVARSTAPLKNVERAEFAALIDPAPVARTPAPTPHKSAVTGAVQPLQPAGLPPLGPMERRMRRKVSKGHKPVDGVIDLHGMRQTEAHTALINFVIRAQAQSCVIVLVITGKGATTADDSERGVLRRMVPHWLADPVMRRFVIGFEPAARGHGGEGSLYVRIRRPRA